MAINSQIGVVAPPPIYSRIMDWATGRAQIDWIRWFNSITQAFGATAASVGSVELSNQVTSIAPTAVNTPQLGRGLYRVNVYARVSVAATVSSSLSVTIQWIDDGITCSAVLGPVTGNTTATVLQGSVLASLDQATSVTYSSAYASAGVTNMQYKLLLSVEDLP